MEQPETRPASELKRLRAYEGLVLGLVVVGAFVIFGSVLAIALSSSLSEAARAFGP